MVVARPVQKKRPEPRHRAKTTLRVIPGGASSSGSRRASVSKPKVERVAVKSKVASRKTNLLFVAAVALTVGVLVFGLVLINIYLAQTSFRLEELQSRVASEQERYRRMRLQVATAESPEKVAQAAAGLGLVVPEQQEYILGPEQVRVAHHKPRNVDGDLKGVLGAGR